MSDTLSEAVDSLLPRREAFRRLGFSVAHGLRLERSDPTFPRPVAVRGRNGGTRGYYRASELQAWVRGLQQWTGDEALRERNRANISNAAHVKAARARTTEAA